MAAKLSRAEDALEYRRESRGVIGVRSKVPIKDASVLSLVYTPGVAGASLQVARDGASSFDLTCRGNTVAIVTDGSRVFELGNAGPEAALPIMEGKSVIIKTFAGVDAFPLCLATQEVDEIVRTMTLLAPTFGAICLEDIAAPRSLEIADQLQAAVSIPVFHNHYHATAVVVLAGLINALKAVGKELADIRVVVSGAGAAAIGVARLLLEAGARDIVLCDRAGALYQGRDHHMNWAKEEIAQLTNREGRRGPLGEIIRGSDVFIGLSGGGIATTEMVAAMAPRAVVFALAVPEPEISPKAALAGGAAVVATARSDFANQIDIALVFPGFFRGLLDSRARRVVSPMLLAAAQVLAGLVSDEELRADYIVPPVFDFRIAPVVAAAVAKAARETQEATVGVDPEEVAERTRRFIYEGEMPVPPRPRRSHPISLEDEAIDLHRRHRGVLEVVSKIPIKDRYILSLFYLPPCTVEPAEAIMKDRTKVYDYTAKGNLVAIITDGSAVLGLGDIGACGALPVMEGKAVLFQALAGVEAFPLCLDTRNPDEIVAAVKALVPAFGGINLEDISAPRCFAIEERLRQECDIPVFHDDQHGTAVVVLAGLLNALKMVGKALEDISVVINGAGAAGIASAKLLLAVGVRDMVICDRAGAIFQGRQVDMNWAKERIAQDTNPAGLRGTLAEAIAGRDVFIGVSRGGMLTGDMVRSMAARPIVFALANPVPEIWPEEAKAAGAEVVATGRSDLDNQINNSLAFPGMFRGALDVRARNINEAMKIAAAHAIAGLVSQKELRPEHIIPKGLDFRVAPRVAAAVARAAIESGEARLIVDPESIAENTIRFVYEGHLGPLGPAIGTGSLTGPKGEDNAG